MNRELLDEEAYVRRRDAAARRIFPFLKEMVLQGRVEPYSFNRDQVLLFADAIRSKTFMAEVEKDEVLSYDLKVQLANMVSAMNKGWPAVRKIVFSDSSIEIAGILVAIVDNVTRVLEACGVEALPGPLLREEARRVGSDSP